MFQKKIRIIFINVYQANIKRGIRDEIECK